MIKQPYSGRSDFNLEDKLRIRLIRNYRITIKIYTYMFIEQKHPMMGAIQQVLRVIMNSSHSDL